MKFRLQFVALIVSALFATDPTLMLASDVGNPRLVQAADSDWRFLLGDPQGAAAILFDESGWRHVDLPHDWSIEGQFDKSSSTGAGEGYLPGGVGWYRKSFAAPSAWRGKRVSVEFDGVYKNATVYLNGHKLGSHAYGYTSFKFDLTKDLALGNRNVLAVRVDNSEQPNSRWYTGSGIYRHVRFVVTDATHIDHWGVFVTTPTVTQTSATVSLQTRVVNETTEPALVDVETLLIDDTGSTISTANSKITITPGATADASQTLVVHDPHAWSLASPTLYRAVSRIRRGGWLVDSMVTPFGIRSLSWSADKGLLLNGTPVKLTGGSVHHDNGALGAAAFDRAEERKVELLKAAGQNAVRTAHNPPSPAFLEACDRLGLLVLDEAFDTWEVSKVKFDYSRDFDKSWKSDLSSMILRDRNHPSIVIWSIGNEIPDLELEKGREIGKQLVDEVHSYDRTRPITLAFPGTTTAPNPLSVISLLDITGYNYNLIPNYKGDHQQLPDRLMLTTESFPADVFRLWEISQDNTYVIGDLTWTAEDYLGESATGSWTYGTPKQAALAKQSVAWVGVESKLDQFLLSFVTGEDFGKTLGMDDPATKAELEAVSPQFPWHSAVCGDLDLTGFRKPQSYYRDIIWNGGDRIYATVRLPEPDGKRIIANAWAVYPTLPTWTWPGLEGKPMEVEVYSHLDKVRLYLNDKLVGEKATGREQAFKATFSVPYTAGTVRAIGMRGDRSVAESILATTGEPVHLRLTPDRKVLHADGQDLSFIVVEAVDGKGQLQMNAQQEVEFSINGPGTIAAVSNGDGENEDPYQGTRRKLFKGRAQIVIRTSMKPGFIRINARSAGLSDAAVTIQANM